MRSAFSSCFSRLVVLHGLLGHQFGVGQEGEVVDEKDLFPLLLGQGEVIRIEVDVRLPSDEAVHGRCPQGVPGQAQGRPGVMRGAHRDEPVLEDPVLFLGGGVVHPDVDLVLFQHVRQGFQEIGEVPSHARADALQASAVDADDHPGLLEKNAIRTLLFW
jgi:hypothetical protein